MKLKKIISIFLSIGLLLTGCSSNKDEETNNSIGSENIENLPAIENQDTSFNNFNDFLKYRENATHKLSTYLDSENIKYVKADDNSFIKSEKAYYTASDKDYTQFLAYDFIPNYQEELANFTLRISKAYHIDDEINLKDDSYIKLMFKILKKEDKSITENKLKEYVTNFLNQTEEYRTVILNTDSMDFYIEKNKTSYTIHLNQNINFDIDLSDVKELKKEYSTVREFKEKVDYYSNNDTSVQYPEFSDNDTTSFISSKYVQNIDGDLYEEYTFLLSIPRDNIVGEKRNNNKYSSTKLDKEYIVLLNSFIDYMSEHTGLDVSKYITANQLYDAINTSLLKEDLFMPDSFTSLPLGEMRIGHPRLEDSIRITLKLPVIAEGKDKL